MNWKQAKNILVLIFFQGFCFVGISQNMNSPYSVYGIGDIDHRYYNFNSGMGYTGIALKTSLFSNGNNPASIAGIEKKVFMFDAFAAGRAVTYHGNSIDADNSTNRDFTIKKLSLSSYITPFWSSGVGMQQFSNVNYKFQNVKGIEGSNDKYILDYSGDGGLNDFYWNNGFKLGKHFSLGLTASFVAGPINQTETLVDNSGNTIETTRRDYYANGRLEYGAIYSNKINKRWNFSLGGRFSNKTKMNFERTMSVSENSNSLVTEKFLKYTNFHLPKSYGVGIALVNSGGTTLAADYSYNDWSSLGVKGTGWKLTSSNRVAIGGSFASVVNSYNKFTQSRSFQFGAFVDNSYLMVNGKQIMEWGITSGFTKTLKTGLVLGTSLEAGMRGTTQADLIRENYFQLNLSFSWRDILINRKQKFY